MQDPTNTLLTVKSGIASVGAGFVYAAAVVSDLPLPSPSLHGAFEMLMVTLMGWVISEFKKNNKAESNRNTKDSDSGERRSAFMEMLLKQLENLAYGQDNAVNALTAHRVEFATHAATVVTRLDGVVARLDGIDERVDRIEKGKTNTGETKTNTGETKRP